MHHKERFEQQLQLKLEERVANQLYRSLTICDNSIDFSSNDYLGFARSALLKTDIEETRAIVGATGSRLISGNCIEAENAERFIAQFTGVESALIFSSGYMANIGLFSAIAGKGDTFITDEYIHASIIDGIRLSHAQKYKFKHNNIADLEQKLQIAKGTKFVVVESIYSMDGDEAPLLAILDLCDQYQALLIVDEAHAIGVWGIKGSGLVAHYQIQDKVFACIYTFGKALGLHGAAITGNDTLRNYLINFARSFIYTTALPPHNYRQIQTSYQLLEEANRQSLYDIINYFRTAIKKLDFCSFVDSSSQIQGIIIGDNTKAKALSAYLLTKGFFAKAILSPTVPIGTERLRICLHNFNTQNEIDLLISEVKKFLS